MGRTQRSDLHGSLPVRVRWNQLSALSTRSRVTPCEYVPADAASIYHECFHLIIYYSAEMLQTCSLAQFHPLHPIMARLNWQLQHRFMQSCLQPYTVQVSALPLVMDHTRVDTMYCQHPKYKSCTFSFMTNLRTKEMCKHVFKH